MCEHANVTYVYDDAKVAFKGGFSLIGYYRCLDCNEKLDIVEYAKYRGDLDIALLDYYRQFPERLNPIWRDHPWVRHLFHETHN